MKILSKASAKKKTKRLKAFKFCTFVGCFQVTHGSEGVKCNVNAGIHFQLSHTLPQAKTTHLQLCLHQQCTANILSFFPPTTATLHPLTSFPPPPPPPQCFFDFFLFFDILKSTYVHKKYSIAGNRLLGRSAQRNSWRRTRQHACLNLSDQFGFHLHEPLAKQLETTPFSRLFLQKPLWPCCTPTP